MGDDDLLRALVDRQEKIIGKHKITGDEVRDAVVCRRGLVASRKANAEGVDRFILSATIRGKQALVSLYPVKSHDLDGAWNLGSVYFP